MSEYDPGPHAEHAVAPTAENVPGKHDEHAVEVAFAANLPASQASHWIDAEVLVYVPGAQFAHDLDPRDPAKDTVTFANRYAPPHGP